MTGTKPLQVHLAGERVHADDTTVPVLVSSRTVTGRLWTYVRDDRPFGGPAPPAAWFGYSRDRRSDHPATHLDGWSGIVQADAYAGYNALAKPGRGSLHPSRWRAAGRMPDAACSGWPNWAGHLLP